jgi:hypothetical protein
MVQQTPYSHMYNNLNEGAIIVPKSVRPIMEYEETCLGSKKGAAKQFRYGNLHIREYDDHYAVHFDKVNPKINPLGHLLIDAPQYLIGALTALIVGERVGSSVYNHSITKGKNHMASMQEGVIAGLLSGLISGTTNYLATDTISKIKRRRIRNLQFEKLSQFGEILS